MAWAYAIIGRNLLLALLSSLIPLMDRFIRLQLEYHHVCSA